MIDAIVFDFDGVIADSEMAHYRAFSAVLEPFGIAFTYDEYLQVYIGFDDRDCVREAFSRAGKALDHGTLPALCEAKAVAFEALVRAGTETYPGVVELVASAAREVPVAIASGATRADIDLLLAGIDEGRLGPHFRVIVSADDVIRSKPDPQTYAMAAEQIGVAARGCLAIEDTPTGVASAAGAGLRTLGVTNTCAAEMLSKAERVVSSLAGIDLAVLRGWYD